ncbi:hypothetical protein [Rhodococcus sp. 11-3]|uniref:hypothetical protein n=1 Tax=Rhodococcus sp. 11-3 TaxID=2854796 RepID=UPI00203DFD10|nr:hypothetical protein [Rhodococcus sp. 11-3]USC16984.1 hypothetical protein KZJ41_09015 [Rhodococcus sp. 11-3]
MSEFIDPDRFLMGGAKSASFPTVGTVVSGEVISAPEIMQQREPTGELKTYKDGNPMLQMVVSLQTDERDPEDPEDDGERRLFIKSNMKSAVSAAIKRAGAKKLEVGGRLTVKYYADGKQETRGFNPPKLYQAEYVAPAANFLAEKTVQPQTAAAPAASAAAPAGGIDPSALTPEVLAAIAALQK